MKTGEKLSKIVSTSIALILCSAVLAFALTALCWGAALPAYAHVASPPSISSNPQQGSAGTTITVIGTDITPASGSTVSVTFGYSTDTTCNPFSPVGGASDLPVGNGGFIGTFKWPSTAAGSYTVCAQINGLSGVTGTITLAGHSFQASAPSSSSASISSSPASGTSGQQITVTGHNIPPLSGTGTVSVTFGYNAGTNCSSFTPVGSATNETVTNGTFTGTFTWPSTAAGSYTVCAQVNGVSGTLVGSAFQVTSSSSSSASVSVDSSSYKVGDTMTVTGTGFPASTSVTAKLQSSNGATTTTLGTVQTDGNGAFTQDYTVPAHPLNSVVVIVTYGSSQQATSGSFTVKAKSSSSSSTHAPAPAPTSPPPPPPTTYYPPAALAATPTPVPTDTPTPVPTATDTPTPVPTVAPIPTPVPVVATHTTSLFGNLLGGKLPLVLAIGLGTLIGLSLLFVVGRVLLGKFLSPSPAPTISPSGTSPWMGSQGNSLQGNTMLNGAPLGQTMPFDSSFPPGNGGFAPGYGPPQQVPFNSPFGSGTGGFAPGPGNSPFPPADGGFAPGPGNSPQPVPMGGPYQPSTSGFAPVNANEQEPFPPNNWFGSPN